MKKSFTLIEIMVSIVIFSLLVLLMSKVLVTLNISLKSLENMYKEKSLEDYFIKTIYRDILEKRFIKIDNNNKNYSIIYIQTTNSLYKIPAPYVVWYVSKKNNSIIRLESSQKIILPTSKGYVDKFLDNVKIFKIYQKNGKFLVFLKANKEIFFEF